VARINDLPLAGVHQPGRMLGIQEPAVDVDFGYDDMPDDDEVVVVRPSNVPVGPIWADTTELWLSWLETASPWPQVHGHTSAWYRDAWSAYAPPEGVTYAKRDQRLRHTRYDTARGSGPPLLGIDCSVWAARNLVLHPLVIPNARVVGIDLGYRRVFAGRQGVAPASPIACSASGLLVARAGLRRGHLRSALAIATRADGNGPLRAGRRPASSSSHPRTRRPLDKSGRSETRTG
jgi:hypothetical protein